MIRRTPFLASAVLMAVLPQGTALAAEKGPAFFRGINLNGPAVTIDGRRWEGKDAGNYHTRAQGFDNQKVVLKPATDPERAKMIRSSVWGNQTRVTLTGLPDGVYSLFLYVWEDNNSETFSISVNDHEVVPSYDSGEAGHWEKLGPWVTTVNGGAIHLTTAGGAANLSGVEIWQGDLIADQKPSREGVEFFEKKVRPLLVQHCYSCHSADAKKVRGGLLLDSRPGLLKGGDSGPAVVPGAPRQSLLVRAVRHADESLKMPPKGKLSAREIGDLETWVKMGAPDPRTAATIAKEPPRYNFDEARKFWSFRPVRDPPPPALKDSTWARTPIDRFVLARLEAKGMRPAPDADRLALVRRATFGLTGLPPTPEEVDAFLADRSPDAREKLIDRLLASPHYGERWGRHWLDLVRYADTSGCNSDFPVPTAWLYRNYVIDSLNADKPYDLFVREQVAGDLLPHASEARRRELIVATGYLAIGRRFGSLADEFHLTLEDNIDNIGKTVLGLSLGCARCHDHKFDPLPTKDYYALYGILNSARYSFPGTEIPPQPRDFVPLATPEEWKTVVEPYEKQLAEAQKELERREKERDEARARRRKPGEPRPSLAEVNLPVQIAKSRRDALLLKRPRLFKAYAVQEGRPANARLHRKGDPKVLGEEVPRGFLTVLGGQRLPDGFKGSGRLQLAQWLTDPANPLTARVIANRVWQYHFGEGLVRTPNDFGARGTPPTHPDLLDHLAARLVRSGWSLKALHREVMLSRTYQMACIENAEYARRDARNELWWTFSRRRLSAEEFRDAMLAAGGGLDRSKDEEHPFPIPPFRFTQHLPFYGIYDSDCRSVYLMQQRIRKHPWLEVFDGADPNATTDRRPLNTTPIQALFAMNDPFVHQQADRLAARLLAREGDEEGRVDYAHRLAFGRPSTGEERKACADFLAACRAALGDTAIPPDGREAAAWASLARVIFCSSEFSFVD